VTLHPRPSDAELLATAEQRAYHAQQRANAASNERANGIELGPDSPLLKTKRGAGARQAAATRRDNDASEHADQSEIFRWARNEGAEIEPLLATSLFYAVPNGGARGKRVASDLSDEGVTPGVQDMSLDVARGGWHGLRIEQKVDGQRPSQEQVEHAQLLLDQCYLHRFSYSPDYTKDVLLQYLAGDLQR
jgi:hypothetical protein